MYDFLVILHILLYKHEIVKDFKYIVIFILIFLVFR